MTDAQLIVELLQECTHLGIRKEVLDASEKYIDQGASQLEAIESAFNELVDEDWWDDDIYTEEE